MQCAAKSGLAFSIDRGSSMSFVSFGSLKEFECWYLGLSPDMRMLNEVVTSDARKLMLDIDHPSGPKGAEMLDRLLLLDFERHVTSRIHEIFFTLGLGRPEVVFYTMCSDTKISYHVSSVQLRILCTNVRRPVHDSMLRTGVGRLCRHGSIQKGAVRTC